MDLNIRLMEKISYYIIALAALLLSLQMPFSAMTSTSLATDQSALLALKAHITLDPYLILTRNWTNSSSVCSWIGVTCNSRNHRVAALNISEMDLVGTIPPQLGNLSFLVSLDLRYNFFSGNMPEELSLLHRLKFINLLVNNFSGELPSNMCRNIPLLEVIALSWNQFSGQIPSNLSECLQLQVLSLSNNSFSGQIPGEIGKLTSLQILHLGGNNLNGVIPQQIGDLQNLAEFAIGNNQITGSVPLFIFNISSLQLLDLHSNKLTRSLPREIGNLTSLTYLDLSFNNLTGLLPQEIGKLYQLEVVVLRSNSFTGSIPSEFFNISTLQILSIAANNLSGSLPTNLGYGLPVLEQLYLGRNYLSGSIPESITNCSKLRTLSLPSNNFTGFVPHFFGNLRLLEKLQLFRNNLRTESSSSSELSFITSFTNCRFLKFLGFGENPLDGVIPASIGNLSISFQDFHAPDCKIKGNIPEEIGNLSNLMVLYLSYNELTGKIPFTVKHLQKLQGLYLRNNKIEGSIPNGLCDLHSLDSLWLSQNRFSGSIPECLGNVTSLRHLFLDYNMLSSSIPSSLWRIKDLLELDLSSNSLSGFLPPEIGNLVTAISINMSKNNLSKDIPSTIENLQALANLSLAHNSLEGSIPASVGSMISLVALDLSYNNLSGSIPKSLESLQQLNYFNVSFNVLKGEIPSGGPFRNFTVESFKGNEALCGSPRFQVLPCNMKSKKKRLRRALLVPSAVVSLIVVIISLAFILSRYRRKDRLASGNGVLEPNGLARISYYEILQATEQFSESNLLGTGGFGSVYKGIMRDGRVLAVKVFNLQLQGIFKSFDVECEVLRNLRHRNLTKVIGSCSNEDFKALILEYMPKGSLEKWLYSHSYCLDLMQRLNIMIDVAFALEYLHHGYLSPIVHCDLKPSNVLLDEEMIAHVSDFGIAKLLGEGESISHTETLATLGYMAPEYGLEGLVSTRCDVYSYGIILMETFTRKRPSDDMFGEDCSLKIWVERSLPNQAIDADLLYPEEKNFDKTLQCVSSILELALKCSAEYPSDRTNMKEALVELHKIKRQFLM
ncbi:hypothetical protein BUALT_Bualt18G0081900 [Buddleja alternifolia]|uniref:non-specific serine/threonine protein kinase n=1 Tax=Buddleja alternifolia TaxID=168488 RepID=A0AAV6WD48_9LAMI|nr:hypothetical protein BUALT_Bualt18G0081900 [Buddleja alternifolia]